MTHCSNLLINRRLRLAHRCAQTSRIYATHLSSGGTSEMVRRVSSRPLVLPNRTDYGLTFTSDQQWHYDIQIDPMTLDTEVVFERVWLAASRSEVASRRCFSPSATSAGLGVDGNASCRRHTGTFPCTAPQTPPQAVV
jgi:hypothetical protein